MLDKLNNSLMERAKPFLVIGLHIICLILVFHFLSFHDFFKGIGNFKQWDAFWYEKIAKEGYEFKANEASSSGFFPLFSYVWRFTGLGDNGISYLNYTFFIIGILLLKKAFAFSNSFLLLALSVPSMMFMYVPYTEALFFLSTSIFLYGLIRNNYKAIYIGLFFASLTRPTAIFFIPAILFMELMYHKNVKTTFLNVIKYSSVSIAGIFVVLIIQFVKTGVWFAYFKAQTNSWGRVIQIPELPFTTWDGTRILWIDGIALIFGFISFFIVLYFLLKKWLLKKLIEVDKATLFSLCYLVMATLSVVFFNGKDELGGTSLMGANRYVMATPCLVLLLNYFNSNRENIKALSIISLISIIISAFMLGLGSIIKPYNHAYSNRYVLFILFYVLSYLLLSTKQNSKYIFSIYLLNIFAQIILMSYFSNGLWVG